MNWQPEQLLEEKNYLRISLPEDKESVADMSYCQNAIYYFQTSPLNMRLDPEFFKVKKYDIDTELTEILYEARAGTVLQDIVATQNQLFWVEIISENGGIFWELVGYNIVDQKVETLRHGRLGEDTLAEPVLTLSGGYLLWTETDTTLLEHHYSYDLSSRIVKEERTVSFEGTNPYIGDRMLGDSLFYLVTEDGRSELWEDDRCLYFSEEEVMSFSVADQALLWVYQPDNSVRSNARYVPWTKGKKTGAETELPYEELFTARMFGNMIVCMISEGENYYYAFLDVNTGKRHVLYPKKEWNNDFYYPWYSADQTVYLKGMGDCLILKKQ